MSLPPEDSSEQTKPEQPPAKGGEKVDALIAALTAINQASRDADDAHEETRNGHENRMFKLERAGVIGLAIYCFFTFLEWRTFNTERQTMEQEFQMAQKNAVRESQAAEKQLAEMQKEHRLDERAWVLNMRCETDMGSSTNMSVEKVIVQNLGRTPARHIDGYISWWYAKPPSDMLTASNFLSGKDIFPHVPTEALAQGGIIFYKTDDIPNSRLDEVKRNVASIIFYGAVRYDDVFNSRHWSQFCFQIRSNLDTVNPLPFHDSTDDDER